MPSTSYEADLKRLFKETVARHSTPQLSPETASAYFDDWRQECTRVGIWRFSEGVKHARAALDFFPKISQIRQFIPDKTETQDDVKGGSLADYDCPICDGSSWEIGTAPEGHRQAVRCQCWIRNREAGMRPQQTLKRQMADWHRYKREGEKFYTLADVLKEFCRQVESGEMKAADERGQQHLEEWAKSFRGQEKKIAAKMLQGAEEKRA